MNKLSSTSIETAIDVFMNHSGAYFGELESLQVAEALRELLALREAGKEPVAYIGERMLEDLSDGARTCGRVWKVSQDELSCESRIPLYAAPQLPAVTAAEEKLKRVAVILSGSDAPGEIRSLTVTAQSYVDRCQQLAKERDSAVPDEWVMVPIEPTEDMVAAAGVSVILSSDEALLVWNKMIVAAPYPKLK